MEQLQPINKSEEAPVPDGLDYDLWCGPAPMYPYRPGTWWKGLWDYYLEDISKLNSRCGNGWLGTTNEEFAKRLLYGDKNDIEFWFSPQKVI